MKFSFKAVEAAVVNFFKNLFKKSAPEVQEATPTKDATPSTAPVADVVKPTASVTVEAPKPAESNPIEDAYRHSNSDYVEPNAGVSAPAEPQEDGQGNVKFVESVGQNIIVNGSTSKLLHYPEGWKGSTRVSVNYNTTTKYPFSVFVNGDLIGTAVTNGVVTKDFDNPQGTMVVHVDQVADSSVTLEFYNNPAK